MIPSRFTVRVPIPARQEVFLLHTLTDAQAVVSEDVDARLFDGDCSRPAPWDAHTAHLEEATRTLAELGFLVRAREQDDRELDRYFGAIRNDTSELRVTVLTTLRCNFGCDYCLQGDHESGAAHMSPEEAARVCTWIEAQLDAVRPRHLAITFFGGEPLLNLPALEIVARGAHAAATSRGVATTLDIITNGLLLTPAVVDRLLPLGLRGVKITLDGDRDRHDRQRPLRGGQGTFDRIVENLRAIAGRCAIAIGGNVDADALEDCTRLLDRLAAEPFAASISKVSFKPIVKRAPAGSPRVIPLVPAERARPDAAASSSPCDTCAFADEAFSTLRGETTRRGFVTPDGVHMGPCELHHRHAHAIGPDGTRYLCPGFAGSPAHAIGHVARPATAAERQMSLRRDSLAAWRACGDCAFVPVCAGGCSLAAHHERHDMDAPDCHRSAFEAAAIDFAHTVLSQEPS